MKGLKATAEQFGELMFIMSWYMALYSKVSSVPMDCLGNYSQYVLGFGLQATTGGMYVGFTVRSVVYTWTVSEIVARMC